MGKQEFDEALVEKERVADAMIARTLGWLNVRKVGGHWIGIPPSDLLDSAPSGAAYALPGFMSLVEHAVHGLRPRTWEMLRDTATAAVMDSVRETVSPAQTNEQDAHLAEGWYNETPQGALIRSIDQLTCVVQEAMRRSEPKPDPGGAITSALSGIDQTLRELRDNLWASRANATSAL